MGCELNSGSIGRIRGLHHIAVLVALPALTLSLDVLDTVSEKLATFGGALNSLAATREKPLISSPTLSLCSSTLRP